MNIRTRHSTLLCCMGIFPGALFSQFTPGRLAILEMPFIWNGSTYIVPTTGGQLVIREFATDGTPGISVAIPNTGPNMLVSNFQSGGASLTRSPAGDLLVFTGFTGTSDGSFNLSTSSASTVPRGIGTVDAAGTYARPFVTSTFFGGAPLKAACTDGVNFWAAGGTSGVCYLGPGTPAVINADQIGAEDLQFTSIGLLRGAGNGGLQVVGSGSPVTAASQQPLLQFSVLQGFQMSPTGDVCYVNNGFQIRKWVLTGGTWTTAYTFSAGTPLSRIAVDWSTAQPIIYGVKNSPSSLIKFVDAGAPSAAITLATTNGAAWYGITFTPVSTCVPGTPCNDGDANTTNDAIRADCQCAGAAVAVAAKVLLEGPYVSGTGLMTDALRTLPDFPLSEPFTALGLSPTGGEVGIAASVLSTNGNDAIVDWVLVELRDAATGMVVLMRTAALLQRDGDVVGLNGTSPLNMPILAGSYRIAVRHRNHLGVLTDPAYPLDGTPTTVDLTTAATVTWGTDARKNVNGVLVLWAGNCTSDNELKYTGGGNDRDPILVSIGGTLPTNTITGYHTTDVTMDGTVKYTGSTNDRDPLLVNIGGTVPTNTRAQQLP